MLNTYRDKGHQQYTAVHTTFLDTHTVTKGILYSIRGAGSNLGWRDTGDIMLPTKEVMVDFPMELLRKLESGSSAPFSILSWLLW